MVFVIDINTFMAIEYKHIFIKQKQAINKWLIYNKNH